MLSSAQESVAPLLQRSCYMKQQISDFHKHRFVTQKTGGITCCAKRWLFPNFTHISTAFFKDNQVSNHISTTFLSILMQVNQVCFHGKLENSEFFAVFI